MQAPMWCRQPIETDAWYLSRKPSPDLAVRPPVANFGKGALLDDTSRLKAFRSDNALVRIRLTEPSPRYAAAL